MAARYSPSGITLLCFKLEPSMEGGGPSQLRTAGVASAAAAALSVFVTGGDPAASPGKDYFYHWRKPRRGEHRRRNTR